MREVFKKKMLLLSTALMFPIFANAQIDVNQEISKYGNGIIRSFGIIAIVGLVVVFIYNLEHFTSKQGDMKKGIWAIIIYLILVGLVVGAASYLRSVSL